MIDRGYRFSYGMVKEQLRSLGIDIQPVFRCKSIQHILWPKERKPDLVDNQWFLPFYRNVL